MSEIHARARHVVCGALLSVAVGLPAVADDIEIYRNAQYGQGIRPNVLFIMDTSGSMDTQLDATPVYDPSTTYSGDCATNRIYYSTSDTVPDCDTGPSFPVASNVCDAARTQLGTGGGGMWPAFGNSRERLGQYRSSPAQWQALDGSDDGSIECYADDGLHGASVSSNDRFIQNNGGSGFGATSAGLWDTAALNNRTYRLYSANYLNYYTTVGRTPVQMTRLQVVRDVAISLAGSLQNVNLGLMRYDSGAQGGMVLHAVGDIATNRTSIVSTLKAFGDYSGDGYTPLSETLFEASRYYRGQTVFYGNSSSPQRSVTASRLPTDSTRYDSPIDSKCQKNYVVFLTDGLPTRDQDANDDIANLPTVGACAGTTPESSGSSPGDGICADELAGYLNKTDLSSLPDTQNVSTYMIGFGEDVANSVDFLDNIAKAGGTEKAYTAANTADLTAALQNIFNRIQKQGATFITPSVTINAFNRAQTTDELYFSLFQPDDSLHWAGNLKKYRMKAGTVIDDAGREAINSQGYFAPGTRSVWSDSDDGADVTRGGAANELPDPQNRKIYTYLTNNPDLTAAGNLFIAGNLSDSAVGSGTSADCTQACQDTVKWARGIDVADIDGDRNLTEPSRMMGDPLHGRPGIVSYGGSKSDRKTDDVVVYVPTNDGFLHAIDGKTGTELWAFIPPELLSRLFLLKENGLARTRSYGLDGDIRVLKFDRNQDGVVTASEGDYVWLFFGMRAGGNHYFALDVTNRNNPRLKWDIGPDVTQLAGVGQTWSAPVITRVQVGPPPTTPGDPKFVLIFGGGYDTTQESQPYAADNVGNRIYIVDADTGTRLWFAGGPSTSPTAGTPNLFLREMTNSIPAGLTVIDTNGDTFADRIYAGDMGGRLWRFDIANGQPARSLVTGGVLAKLGAGSNPNATAADARRFYNAPDVALISQNGQDPYYNIAIGSGYRGHPLNTDTDEYFFSVRDLRPYARLKQEEHDAFAPIAMGDLFDLTSTLNTPTTPAGWKFRIGAAGSGEKVLSKAVTFNDVILFTSFQPGAATADTPCYPTNINRAYAVSTTTGRPALDFNNDTRIDLQDRSYTLKQNTGIAGDVSIAFDRSDNGSDPTKSPGQPEVYCRVGTEKLRVCVTGPGTTRTFWQRRGAP
jgi:type IV pilus assembly protein PilY1